MDKKQRGTTAPRGKLTRGAAPRSKTSHGKTSRDDTAPRSRAFREDAAPRTRAPRDATAPRTRTYRDDAAPRGKALREPGQRDAAARGKAPRGTTLRSKAERAPATARAAPAQGVAPHDTSSRSATGEKLQKVLARAGFGSRRELEEWIGAGRIKVNGKPAQLGDRVEASDKILVDGKKVVAQDKEASTHPILLYNKPLGEICTRNDPEGRPTVYDHLPPLQHSRWVSVGRLDINTTGLLLFTTDGELANRLMHPSAQIEREYAVRVMGEVTPDILETLQRGVMLEDGVASFAAIQYAGGEGANHWYHVVLMEGRNREVRRLWEAQGLKVSRLKRVRYGNIVIPSFVRAGKWVELPAAEARSLYQLAGLRWKAPQKPGEYRTRYEAKQRGDKRIPKPKDKRVRSGTPYASAADGRRGGASSGREGRVWPATGKTRR